MLDRLLHLSIRRWIGMILGNAGLAIGVCVFRVAALGNDPFSGMVFAISDYTVLKYSICLLTLNCFLFLFEIWKGRDMIGAGTFVNWFLIGYIVDFFYPFLQKYVTPTELWQKILIMVLGVLVTSFSCSLYQQAKAGISPYDSASLMLTRGTKVPYFWCRIFTDVICTIVCVVLGGQVGVGTLVSALGLGPFIAFFNRTISDPFYKNKKKE